MSKDVVESEGDTDIVLTQYSFNESREHGIHLFMEGDTVLRHALDESVSFVRLKANGEVVSDFPTNQGWEK